jgi:hypothetical protein
MHAACPTAWRIRLFPRPLWPTRITFSRRRTKSHVANCSTLRRSNPLALNSQSKPSRVVISRKYAALIRRSRARCRLASAGPASKRCKNSRWLSESFSAADNAASSASGAKAMPSVRNAVVTSSCKLRKVATFVARFRVLGVGWLREVGWFGILRSLAQQGLIVGSGSRQCRLPIEKVI